MQTKYKYNTLEDFLISHPLNIDVERDDGWGAKFPIKGIEIDATVLFADITSFTKRTSDLSPTETLIFVNNFFSWITAEAIIRLFHAKWEPLSLGELGTILKLNRSLI